MSHEKGIFVRKIILAILSAAFFVTSAGTMATVASTPSQAVAMQKRCTRDTPLTVHSRYDVEAHLRRTCGHRFEAYGDWQSTGFRFGPPKYSGYDDVCAVAGTNCTGSGGTLLEAGVRKVSNGQLYCEYRCPARVASAGVGR